MKTCSRCNTEKDESEFHKDPKSKDGTSYQCKVCAIARAKEYHAKNRDAVLEKRRTNYDPVKNSERCRNFRINNPELTRERKRRWELAHPNHNKDRYARDKERIRARQIEYNKKNRTNKNADAKRYRQENPEKCAKTKLKCYNAKRARDPAFRILCALRCRLYGAIKGKTKSARTVELLGCSVAELMVHLQNQFQPGMTWQNYGRWEIDHKKACANFDMTNHAQQRECFHYSNLQPLWKLDNILKSDK